MSEALKHLWGQVEEKSYAKSPPKGVLRNILTEIRTIEHSWTSRSWDVLVELLAQWTVRNLDLTLASMSCSAFHGLDLKKHGKLYKHIDDLGLFKRYYVAAKERPWDYPGEIFIDERLDNRRLGQNLTPKTIVQFMTKMNYGDVETKHQAQSICHAFAEDYRLQYLRFYHVPAFHVRPTKIPLQTQLDPCVGTGRFLLGSTTMFPKANLVLFGVEIDVRLYRACIVNMAMFSNHAFSIVCANALRLDPDRTGPTSKMWDLGNRWDPADITEFYWKPTPFLTGYIKANKTA
jgi:hypothetical protein